MLILKVEIKYIQPAGGLREFIEEVFIKRNWDLYLTLVLKANKENLIALVENEALKNALKQIELFVELKNNQRKLKSLLIKNGLKSFNLKNFSGNKIINFDSTMDYSFIDNLLINILDFEKCNGLIPTIIQDKHNNVLMLAYSSKESLKRTIETKQATYFSRSRNKIWVKGEESGNFQTMLKIFYDCDADTLLFRVKQKGSACHTGTYSCFQNTRFSIGDLYNIIKDRIKNAKLEESYTKKLAEDNKLLLSKIQEESLEVINYTDRDNLIWEIADLTYFILVLMATKKINLNEIVNELWRRNQ
jgi:phosphoribosyl-ATP pyrophosphohydrolase/phosphoribosyl-AMP cyclohydrolase